MADNNKTKERSIWDLRTWFPTNADRNAAYSAWFSGRKTFSAAQQASPSSVVNTANARNKTLFKFLRNGPELAANQSPYTFHVSTGKSGLSWGIVQSDSGNNARALNVLRNILARAQAENRITAARAQILLDVGSLNYLSDKFSAGTNPAIVAYGGTKSQYVNEMNSLIVTQKMKDVIDSGDVAELGVKLSSIDKILTKVLSARSSKTGLNGNLGVFDPNNPDHDMAIYTLISWNNRAPISDVGNFQKFLSTTPNLTLQDIKTYMSGFVQFKPTSQGGSGESFSSWFSRVESGAAAVGDNKIKFRYTGKNNKGQDQYELLTVSANGRDEGLLLRVGLTVTDRSADGETGTVVVTSMDTVTGELVTEPVYQVPLLATMGRILGSSLGNMIDVGSPAVNVATGSLLTALALNFGQMLDGTFKTGQQIVRYQFDAANQLQPVGGKVWTDFGADFNELFQGAAVGTASTLMAAELSKALGLKGFGGELATSVGGSVLSEIFSTTTGIGDGIRGVFNRFASSAVGATGAKFTSFGQALGSVNFGSVIGSSITSFFGSKLANAIVSPKTQAGAILGSIGAAVGSAILVGMPVVGEFIGRVIGTFIGNLFGKKKPRVPTASADSSLSFATGRYEVTSVVSANGGSLDLVRSMASAATDELNSLISRLSVNFDQALSWNVTGINQRYGHTGAQIWVEAGAGRQNVSGADAAVDYGVSRASKLLHIAGGNLFAKRALLATDATDVLGIEADLNVARQYSSYLVDQEIINEELARTWNTLTESERNFVAANSTLVDRVIAKDSKPLSAADQAAYNANAGVINGIIGKLTVSQLAAGWMITLQRVSELGLDKWTVSDFYGGLRGFLGSFDLPGHGVGLENANFQWNGTDFTVSVAGGTEGLFYIMPSSGEDGRSVRINGLDKIGYSWVGAGGATSGNDYMEYRWHGAGVTLDDSHDEYVSDGYQQWNGWDYDWIDTSYWTTVSGGDDIFVGSQYGDTLYGRSGWDWLDGQAGNDALDGGEGNDTLLGGSGDDNLWGGAGDDYLAGGDGADGAFGGAGNDILADGQGSECLLGEDGDDTFLIAEDATFNWFWGGTSDPNSDPNGKDTISAERLNFGVAFDIDFRPSDWNGHPDVVAGNPISRAAIVTNAATGAWVTSEGLLSIENATGSYYADRLYGTIGDNVLKGLAGNDQIWGRDGNDTIEGGVGADAMDGGGGYDWLSYASSLEGVIIDLSNGTAQGGDATGDTFSGFEAVRGTRLSDQLKGYNGGDNWLDGGIGDDWLIATSGNDVFVGGEGEDFVDYSQGFASGTSTYQVWVEDGYWEHDQWDNSQYWVSTGGHYETTTTTVAALTVNLGAGTAQVRGADGVASTHSFISIEGVVGTAEGDTMYGANAAETYVGGKGNDYLAGGLGSDTYMFNRGDGYDTIVEDNSGSNILTFGEDVKFSDFTFGTNGGGGGWFDFYIRGTSDTVRVSGNFATRNNNRVKYFDMNGAGQLDIGSIDFGRGGTDGNDVINGTSSYDDFIAGYNGNDVITGSGTAYEGRGNVIIGGLGDDTISTSGGDDQFAYDRGDGFDTITDTGGEDAIVFGSTVEAEDVIYEVIGNDLYIGLKDDDGSRTGSVANRIRIVNGGVKTIVRDGASQTVMYESLNTVEYVLAGGTSVDLRKTNIAWKVEYVDNYDYYYPIALDLDGDGLNMSAVDSSEVVVKTAGGGISRIGWVGPTDGFLAVDRDGDGAINKLSEISFVQDKPGATSDLEGLRTWDSNGDGLLDKNDKDFSKILLFVDANQNGRSTAKELRTLEQAGIAAINLGGQSTGYTRDLTIESFVQNTISFIWADGRTGEGYDVALARRVLGSDGYNAGAYQAEWGAANEDGELGRLSNDPKAAAKAARIKARKGVLDVLGASYDEVKAAAQLDFSDHDRVDAQIAKRWQKMSASEQASWLSGQGPSDKLRLISAEQSLFNALNAAAQVRQDVVDQGYAQAGQTVSLGGLDGLGGTGQGAYAGAPADLGVSFGAAGLGLSASGGEPLETGPAYGGATAQADAWWRQEADAGLLGGGSLASRLAIMGAQPGRGTSPLGAVDADLLHRQALLRQAMAGFGGDAGGSAAVWTRDGGGQETPLAASAGLKAASRQAALTA